MKLSRFNFSQQRNAYWIVYNSASSNCIVLTNTAYNDFLHMTCKEGDRQNYCLLGFYVDENFDEINALIENSKYRLNNFSKKKFRYEEKYGKYYYWVRSRVCGRRRCGYGY